MSSLLCSGSEKHVVLFTCRQSERKKKNICLLLLRWALLLVYRLMDWKSVKRSMTIWDFFFSLVLNTFWNLFFFPPCWFLWQFSSAIWQQRNTSDYFILPPLCLNIHTCPPHIAFLKLIKCNATFQPRKQWTWCCNNVWGDCVKFLVLSH